MTALLESKRTEETPAGQIPQHFTKSHHGSLAWLILKTHVKLISLCNVPSHPLALQALR